MTMYLAVIGGLVLLLLAGDLLVRGAVALAVRLDISPLIIGLTIVAFGTSAPELMISLEAALGGLPGIAIGNVIGSNIANVLLVLGVPAIIYPICCDQSGIRRNTFMMIGATLVFIAFAFQGTFSFTNGFVMVLMLAGFLAYSAWRAMAQNDEDADGMEEVEGIPTGTPRMVIYIVLGLIGLPLGANLLINGASEIAQRFGVSDAVIGLTVVALGTSLPELATTVVAAVRKQTDVAIGNVIGSNLFNILAIMGITAVVTPVPVPDQVLRFDVWIMLATALLILPIALFHKSITRPVGIGFCAAYVAYIMFVLANGAGVA
ncbi:MAG: calcium/sodium antiporter [Alphaproteobacteria bacterium]